MTADSRAVKPGFLFAALPGERADGARFVSQAIEAGAAAILIGDQPLEGKISVPLIRSADPRRALALAAARFYERQPKTVIAVTGTNGKTSVAVFVRQIWQKAGFRAASLGTIGLIAPDGSVRPSLTTPDPVSLHQMLADLADDNVTHLSMEASSHGLQQRRLDGVRLSAGAFTNLTRDHLDYHRTLEDYLRAKLRLFDTLLEEGSHIVVDADEPQAETIRMIAKKRGEIFGSIGRKGETLKLVSVTRMSDGVRLVVEAEGERHYVPLPLVGDFQVSNALVAAALAIATGVPTKVALEALADLKGASGRLELIGSHPSGAQVFVDYAHTPEALAKALQALRAHAEGRLVVIFGAGGDRDTGKRPLMGKAAAGNADHVIVTDDNPRSEDPAAIRKAVLAAAPGAEEIGDRREAIRHAVAGLNKGDVLLVAGKGHETGQTIGDKVLPFSDQQEVRDALAAIAGGSE
ncbi:UDP-N-acetylmuramoylalanyl-D-glutamate--2,6-diaminopimelate ligase [Faunimonas pinastri]|uniref:UDP-N-acetylmuramoyl-L-alanyl-D-glutamate--2,6-diaminopimelate ligase n=1 Tax=Faunimonas pinastri TaxID=1855383 RepID=A0A1H9FT06_9HYPH|nr:UDP-N-acetylmuramoylalanyl-D-glutamate--2,6-diaminopimelate ligase [Faunimonas pinastri]